MGELPIEIYGIDSELRLENLAVEMHQGSMIAFEIEVRSGSFSGRVDEAWIGVESLKRFIQELEALEHTRQGEATLVAIGEDSKYCPFRLHLYSIDRLGHIAASVAIVQSSYRYIRNAHTLVADKVSVTFEIELDGLPRFLRQCQHIATPLAS